LKVTKSLLHISREHIQFQHSLTVCDDTNPEYTDNGCLHEFGLWDLNEPCEENYLKGD